MSTLTSLARAEAVPAGRAQPIAAVRHVHVHDRPLVLIPLTLAGEANAPLAAMVGDYPDSARLLVVAQPRNRDQRFAFAAELASVARAGIPELLDAHPSTEPVHLNVPAKFPDGWEANHAILAHLGAHRVPSP